jgi:polysaccharide export outer membrane protein
VPSVRRLSSRLAEAGSLTITLTMIWLSGKGSTLEPFFQPIDFIMKRQPCPSSPWALGLPTLCACLLLLQLTVSDLVAAEAGREASAVPTPASAPAASPLSSPVPSASSALAVPAPVPEVMDDKQKLAVGDSVIFRVVEDQELAKVLNVTDAGQLDVPELGLVPALGKTCKQLAEEIKVRLEETTYIRATVVMGIHLLNKTMSGRRVHVAGYVLRQGPQDIPPGESWTVSKAILNAGGFTEFADGKNVKLVRSGPKGTPSKTTVINILDVLKKGRSENDVTVEPEDVIYVPIRKW